MPQVQETEISKQLRLKKEKEAKLRRDRAAQRSQHTAIAYDSATIMKNRNSSSSSNQPGGGSGGAAVILGGLAVVGALGFYLQQNGGGSSNASQPGGVRSPTSPTSASKAGASAAKAASDGPKVALGGAEDNRELLAL